MAGQLAPENPLEKGFIPNLNNSGALKNRSAIFMRRRYQQVPVQIGAVPPLFFKNVKVVVWNIFHK